MPDWIAVVILGILEGITEFIPISSTGHLMIGEKCLIAAKWLSGHPSDLFNIVIQCGAVIAVLPLFADRLRQLRHIWTTPFERGYVLKSLVSLALSGISCCIYLKLKGAGWIKTSALMQVVTGAFVVFAAITFLISLKPYWQKIAVAFLVTGIGGLILEKKGFKLEENPRPIAWALIVGGFAFLLVERWLRGKPLRDEVTWTIAFAVGFGQLIAAIFPGASRSGSTILLSLALGLSRPAATEFSFLVGIPTMLAAGGLKIFKALHHAKDVSMAAGGASENWGMVILGTIVAAVVSFAAVKWFLRYIQTHTFSGFGWYRIALGAIVLIFFR